MRDSAMNKWTVVDVFCGVGGLAHGFVREGFHVSAGLDVDETCRYPFERNNGARFIQRNIEQVAASELEQLFGASQKRILVGCAPCQPFSKYTVAQSEDGKWHLLRKFLKLVLQVQPQIVSMENVPELEKHVIFHDVVDALEENGYEVTEQIVNAKDYGIPQNRRRLVLFASKLGQIAMLRPTHYGSRQRTVRDVIEHLEKLSAGEVSQTDLLHRARSLTSLNLRRIRRTPEGGGWKDWPLSLRLKCHKKVTGKSYGAVYGRMSWDRPAPTLTTHCCGIGNGRFGHPEQDRGISIREAALLQTFPRYYELFDPKLPISGKHLCKHLGNAVPVRLGRMIARSIKRHIEEDNGGPRLRAVD
jgi:DNA (cytosine-5)-methyltransferase 1